MNDAFSKMPSSPNLELLLLIVAVLAMGLAFVASLFRACLRFWRPRQRHQEKIADRIRPLNFPDGHPGKERSQGARDAAALSTPPGSSWAWRGNPPERMDEEQVPRSPEPQASSEADRHLLHLVDLLDELEIMGKSGKADIETLDIVKSRISDLITLSDGEIIKDKRWDPDRQRAIEVVTGSGSEAIVLESRRSGLTIGTRIVRKQEIILSKSNSKP